MNCCRCSVLSNVVSGSDTARFWGRLRASEVDDEEDAEEQDTLWLLMRAGGQPASPAPAPPTAPPTTRGEEWTLELSARPPGPLLSPGLLTVRAGGGMSTGSGDLGCAAA